MRGCIGEACSFTIGVPLHIFHQARQAIVRRIVCFTQSCYHGEEMLFSRAEMSLAVRVLL